MPTLTSLNPPTLSDVARAAGVSKATAAQVWRGTGRISPATRSAVLEAAQQIGYNPNAMAQRLASGRSTNLIGLYSLNLDIGLDTVKLKQIQKRLTERGFDVPIYSYGSYGGGERVNEAALMRSLCAQRPLAIIVFTFGMPDDVVAELQRYQDQGGIIVCYSHDVEVPFDNVDFGLCDAIYKATHHLLDLGHRKLAFCYHGVAPEGVPPHPSFARALNDFGLAPNPAWILHDYLYEEAGMRYAAEILGMKDRPTALHVTNDVAASTFVNEIQRGGLLVPRDMSVVGLNDAPAARTAAVRLTTVTHPVEELVGHIVRLLEERIENPSLGGARRVVVNGELIVRESTGPVPSAFEI